MTGLPWMIVLALLACEPNESDDTDTGSSGEDTDSPTGIDDSESETSDPDDASDTSDTSDASDSSDTSDTSDTSDASDASDASDTEDTSVPDPEGLWESTPALAADGPPVRPGVHALDVCAYPYQHNVLGECGLTSYDLEGPDAHALVAVPAGEWMWSTLQLPSQVMYYSLLVSDPVDLTRPTCDARSPSGAYGERAVFWRNDTSDLAERLLSVELGNGAPSSCASTIGLRVTQGPLPHLHETCAAAATDTEDALEAGAWRVDLTDFATLDFTTGCALNTPVAVDAFGGVTVAPGELLRVQAQHTVNLSAYLALYDACDAANTCLTYSAPYSGPANVHWYNPTSAPQRLVFMLSAADYAQVSPATMLVHAERSRPSAIGFDSRAAAVAADAPVPHGVWTADLTGKTHTFTPDTVRGACNPTTHGAVVPDLIIPLHIGVNENVRVRVSAPAEAVNVFLVGADDDECLTVANPAGDVLSFNYQNYAPWDSGASDPGEAFHLVLQAGVNPPVGPVLVEIDAEY